MAGLNRISLIGNLGRDPEVRYTQEGLAIATFSIAVNEKIKGEDKTLWFRISAFGKLGEICGQYLSKGKQVYVDGRLRVSEWVDQEGKNRYTLEVIASTMQMLGTKGDSAEGAGTSPNAGYVRESRPAQPVPPQAPPPAYDNVSLPPQGMSELSEEQSLPPDNDDDVPF